VTVNTVNVDFNPVASFSSDSVCVGDVTTLIDASSVTNSTISSWNMSFGDGNTGNASPAPNVYPNPGNYTAQLQVTSAEGCTNTVDGNVYVRALPVSEFSIIDVCFYETVTTNNNSSIGAGTMIYAWDFGDATPLDFNLNPTHNYLTSGVYNVTLAATSNFGCTHDTMMQINIYDKPIADFSIDGACLNDNSFFIDNSSILNVINADLINSWEWDMDGDLISNYSSQNPSHIYQAEGGHMTELIATTAFGCKDTLTLPVDVWPLPDVNFDFINLCLNDTTQFGDLSIISNTFTMNSLDNYNWNFDDGATSTSQNPAHVYGNYGDYNVSLNVISNNGCENNFLNVVNIRPLPFPNFTSTEICVNTPPTQFTDNTVVLFGNTSQWLWNFGDGNTSNSQNPSHIYNAEGTYQVELTATSAFGCVNDTIMSAIVYEKPTANFTSDITIACNPSDIMFADLSTSMTSNITGWEWSFGNGTTSTEQNPNINYVNENSESEYFDVELIVTNDLGCQDIIYVDNYIQIIPTPVASFTYSPTVLTLSNSETNFTNQSINSDEYLWNFGYDAPTSGSENPTHTFPSDESGSYEVQLTAYSYGQTCTDIAWATVVVEDVIVFYVPNVFTPDNDIFNQIWKPIFTSGYDSYDYHLILFNRWGETVWESYNAEEGWNGYYAGRNELVEDGVYVWTIEFKETMSDKRHKHDGFVTILK
jgi:gliding motility-associated-like protein